MKYMSVKETATKWSISERRVRILCKEGRIKGVQKQGISYMIPEDSLKPSDKRISRHYKISDSYREIFEEIDNLKGQLAKKRPLTQGELQRLQEEFLVEFTYHSNAIEGNTLTLQETMMVMEGITIDQKPLKEHLEVSGHKDAFLYIVDLVKNKIPFSERVIKDIHSLVLLDRPMDRGVYRQIPIRIMGAFQTPPEPFFVEELMKKLIQKFKHTKLHPIEVVARFHLEFEGIHPFVDGNGRTGRLIMNLYLMQQGYQPINIKFSDRKTYYHSFDSYCRDNSADEMILIVAKYLKERFEYILSFL